VVAYRVLALFLALALFWGGSFPAIEVGLEAFPPVTFAAIRYDIGGTLLLGYAVVATDEWRPTRVDVAWLLGCGTFLIAGNGLLFVGQRYTTGGVASIIFSLIPVLTTGLAWLIVPEDKPTAVGFLGVLVGLLGVVAITQPDPSNLLAPGVIGKGLVFSAAVSVALGSVVVRISKSSLPDTAFLAWSMLVGALLLHAAGLGVGESVADVALSPSGVGALAYITVASTAVAFVIYFHFIDNYGILEANLVNYVVPIVATLVGWAYLSEAITVWTVVGFLLIFVGFVLVKRDVLRTEVQRFLASAADR
jgi:drug/metabolite transporter (DMT)-like permease